MATRKRRSQGQLLSKLAQPTQSEDVIFSATLVHHLGRSVVYKYILNTIPVVMPSLTENTIEQLELPSLDSHRTSACVSLASGLLVIKANT